MKTPAILSVVIFLLFTNALPAQTNQYFDVELSDLDGRVLQFNSLFSPESDFPLLVLFWNTNDPQSFDAMSGFWERYKDSLIRQKVRVVSIVTDNNGYALRVKTFVYGHNIDMDVFIDRNGNVVRRFGDMHIPRLILFSGSGELVGQQFITSDIDEQLIYKKLIRFENPKSGMNDALTSELK